MSSRPTLYKGKSGQWAFVLHRVTGFGVFFFLLLHIVDVALVSNARRYNEVHRRVASEGTDKPQLRPRQNFETWSWFFMRISGLALVFLALTHFAITHIANDVTHTDYGYVVRRWHNPLWRLFDWSLLTLALLHGLNGIRYILDDYVRRPATRAAAKAALYTGTLALFFYGTLTIVTFSPR